jgi:hypothetical protein
MNPLSKKLIRLGLLAAVTGTCWAPEGMALACKPKDAPNESSRPPRH